MSTAVATSPPRRAWSDRRTRGTDLALLAAFTVLLRLPALLASRHLTFDDGTFSSSALAMRRGDVPFRDVFSSQGPLFLPLVWVADLVGLRASNAPRLLNVAAGVGLVLAVYAAARHVASRERALLAACLTAASGMVLWVTAPVAADGPALAFATAAVALALGYRTNPTTRRAVAIGLAMGAALSIKTLVVGALVPIGLVLLYARRPKATALAAATAAAFYVVAALPWGIGDVIDQSVVYHMQATREARETPLDNLAKLTTTVLSRDLILAALALLAAGFALARRRPPSTSGPWPSVGVLLGLWLAVAAALLIFRDPMWRPQLVQLVPPAALLVSLRPPPWRVVVAVVVLALPWHVTQLRGVLWPRPYRGVEAALQADLKALPEGAWVLSDEPGFLWRAGRETAADFVDPSISLIRSERITEASLAAAAARPQVCGVLVWSPRFRDFDGLPARLRAAGYDVAATYPGDRTLYEKADCEAVPDP